MSEYHTPVLLNESISALVLNPSGIYADVTFGGGGHTAGILSRLNEDGHVIAFDRDIDALGNRIYDPRLTLVRADFRFIHNFVLATAHDNEALRDRLQKGLDGILADLGVSSHQFDTAERGFSFRYDAPLDMRMNRDGGITAEDVVNEYSQEDLERIFKLYGEVDNSRKIASLVVNTFSISALFSSSIVFPPHSFIISRAACPPRVIPCRLWEKYSSSCAKVHVSAMSIWSSGTPAASITSLSRRDRDT